MSDNRALFAIRYADDVWMNQHGNLGSKAMCRVFDAADEAQAFLDSRRLRRGLRERLAVTPVSVSEIRAMANDAADCLAAARKHGDAQSALVWNGRFAALVDLLPATAFA
jgi:hypothetical protein